MPSPTIYFVRHGETDWNAEARLQGQRDVPLNAVGRGQADEAAGRLRRLVPAFAQLDYVASPLSRASETMERLRRALGLLPTAYRTDDRLKEIRFGSWEGLTWTEVRERYPEAIRSRKADPWNFTPPAGESYADLADRVVPFLDELGRDSLVVAHGGVARVILAMLSEVPRREALTMPIWQGRVLVCRKDAYQWV